MKKALFILLTAAVLAGCNKEESKTPASPSADPALVVPAEELLAQLKLATVTSASPALAQRLPAGLPRSMPYWAKP